MSRSTVAPASPAVPLSPHRRQPLPVSSVRLSADGSLGSWQERNGKATIPHCIQQLEEAGNLDNFRRLLGESEAEFRGFCFADSDIYKTIEAVAWEIARTGTNRYASWLDQVIDLIARVQDETGYVMTYVQGVIPEERFIRLDWAHEMYVLGHLLQAGIALDRANGDDRVLQIAVRFVHLVDEKFGPDAPQVGYCGHPELETALVELYRHTADERYLRLAEHQINHRGSGVLRVGALGAHYFQDHLPVRESRDAVGHAVRQLYLNAGVTDVYLETGEPALLDVMQAQWDSVHERKMYLTGAFGSRHRDESFGNDYELPSDRAYAETCATIADIHWNWRMYLAEGGARYGETIEREIYNALAASLDETGTRFFYSNPLQMRPDRFSEENAPRDRTPWYSCACCPPNIARLMAQLGAYVASVDDGHLAIHLLTSAEIDVPAALGGGTLTIQTSYPSEGSVSLTGPAGTPVAIRVPSWGAVTASDQPVQADPDGYFRTHLGEDPLLLEVALLPRWTRGHHRIDAVRGAVALERGPLVYCLEQDDLPADHTLDDIVVDADEAPTGTGDQIHITASLRQTGDSLYPPASEVETFTAPFRVRAIPFHTWGNRNSGAMRVWLPSA